MKTLSLLVLPLSFAFADQPHCPDGTASALVTDTSSIFTVGPILSHYRFGDSREVARVSFTMDRFDFFDAGEVWLSIQRAQETPNGVTPYTPDATTIRTQKQPVVTKTADGWVITFQP